MKSSQENKKNMYAALNAEINHSHDAVKTICEQIFANPELGYQEQKASQWQCDFLRENGFEVVEKYGNLPTAFRASFGHGDLKFGIFSEYDALPDLGHACGHPLIASCALTAAAAIKSVIGRYKIDGRIVVIGSPAEESYGGKVELLKQGLLDDLNCVMICHPFYCTALDPGNLAVSRFDVEFLGRSAHAAASPELGINALDAMNLLYAGIGAWRQQLPPGGKIHGIITNGGYAPNIIPDETAAFFYVRALENSTHQKMEQRFADIVKGAALMTGCNYKLNPRENSYCVNLPNPALMDFVHKAMVDLDMNVQTVTDRISTDFANVSMVIPGINFLFQAVESSEHISLHSKEFCSNAQSAFAFEQAMKAAQIMGQCAINYYMDESFRERIYSDFQSASGR